jgi:hypothetical protein
MNLEFLQRIWNNIKISNLMKIRPVMSFRNFGKEPNNSTITLPDQKIILTTEDFIFTFTQACMENSPRLHVSLT